MISFIFFVVFAIAMLLIKQVLEGSVGFVFSSDPSVLMGANVFDATAYAHGISKFLLENIIE